MQAMERPWLGASGEEARVGDRLGSDGRRTSGRFGRQMMEPLYPEFERFLTEQEKDEAYYEGCAYSDRWEDDDREAEQEEETSRFLLEALSYA